MCNIFENKEKIPLIKNKKIYFISSLSNSNSQGHKNYFRTLDKAQKEFYQSISMYKSLRGGSEEVTLILCESFNGEVKEINKWYKPNNIDKEYWKMIDKYESEGEARQKAKVGIFESDDTNFNDN